MHLTAFLSKNKFLIASLILFFIFLFFRLYQIPERNPFSWDQLDNAWAAKNILYDHHFPLVGMEAKQNSGFNIGPLYYYLIALVYHLTNLDPIASGIFAAVTAAFSFWGIYIIGRRLCGDDVTFIALVIHTFSTEAIHFDRVQWPVNFIPLLGLCACYFLYQLIQGQAKHIISLAVVCGLFWQVHFTAIFIPIIFLCCVPFIPRTKKMIIYSFYSIVVLIISFAPNIISEMMNTHARTNSMLVYLKTYSHGFHLRRMFQIIADIFTQLDNYLPREVRPFGIRFLFYPIFFIGSFYSFLFGSSQLKRKKELTLLFLVSLFFFVPWVVFTIYSGETSDYYYAINRFICLMLLAYPFALLWRVKHIFFKGIPLLIIGYYLYSNIYSFFVWPEKSDLPRLRQEMQKQAQYQQYVPYRWGDPKSYLYWYYSYLNGKNVY